MTRKWHMRQAGGGDLQTVLKILSMRVIWLHEKGSDQWSTFPTWPEKMSKAISCGQTWLLETSHHEPIGTVTVSTQGDPEFWTAAELARQALYVAKLATVPPDYVGENTTVPPKEIRGLGRAMLEWSIDYAAREGFEMVRLDVWRTAHDLHHWYERNGWPRVRTVKLPHRKSGALFERPAERRPLPNIVEVPHHMSSVVSVMSDDC